MVVDDDDVGFGGALVHQGDEAALELFALLAGAELAAGVEVVQFPNAEWSEMEKSVRNLWAEYAKEDPKLAARAVKMLQDYLAELGR